MLDSYCLPIAYNETYSVTDMDYNHIVRYINYVIIIKIIKIIFNNHHQKFYINFQPLITG